MIEIVGNSFNAPKLLPFQNSLTNKPYTKDSNILHKVSIHRDKEKGLLIGEVRLFADSESPTYEVILRKLK